MNIFTTIDRYILKKILTTFFFVVLILVSVVAVIDLTEKVDKFSRNNVEASLIIGYYLDYIPWVAGLIAPITVFIAIVVVTSQLAARTEIIAILSSGVSFPRLLVPYFIGALILASLSFFLNGWVIPNATKTRLAFEVKYLGKNYYFDKKNLHMQVQPNVYLYLQNYNNRSHVGYQFSLERFEDNRLVEKLTADNIQWDSTKQKWTLKFWKRKRVDSLFQITQPSQSVTANNLQEKETIELQPKKVRRNDSLFRVAKTVSVGSLTQTGDALDTVLAITPKDFGSDQSKYDGMTIPELRRHIAKMKFRGAAGVEEFQTQEHILYASPFTMIVLVFMGVIVSARKSRGGTGFQIALGFLLSFVFILFFMMTRTFAETGAMPPMLAAWLPNLVFIVISLLMYKFVPR